MKKLIFGLIFLAMGNYAMASTCKVKALNVAKAIDKVYVPKPSPKTKTTISLHESTPSSEQYVINFSVPNAGGQTAYIVRMESGTCFIMNLSQLSE